MKINSKVSIIMNCKNGEKTIFEAINSIILQTYKNWELVLFDNNSNDRSIIIAKSFKDRRIKIFKNKKNMKLGEARFYASKKSKGDYLCFLDTDDVWFPEKLMEQLNFFKNKNVGAVYTNSIYFNDKKSLILYKTNQVSGYIFRNLINNYHISFDTIIFKNSFLKSNNIQIDKKFDVIHDLDIIVRLSKNCKITYCPKILSKWRISRTSDSFNKKKTIIQEKFLLHKKLLNSIKERDYIPDLINFKKKINEEKIIFQIFSKKKINFEELKILKFGLKSFLIYILYFSPFKKFLFKIIRKIFPTRLMFNI